MAPIHPVDDHGDGALSNSKHGPYVSLSHASSAKLANLNDLILGEFGTVVKNSRAKRDSESRSSFVYAIANIVGLRSNKQVARVIASAVVAFVANAKPVIYSAVFQGIGQTMSEKVMTVNQDGPVSIAIPIVGPFQTLFGVMVSYGFN